MRERCHDCWNLIRCCVCSDGWSTTCGPVPWFDDVTQPVDLRAEFQSVRSRQYARAWVALDLERRFYEQHLQN